MRYSVCKCKAHSDRLRILQWWECMHYGGYGERTFFSSLGQVWGRDDVCVAYESSWVQRDLWQLPQRTLIINSINVLIILYCTVLYCIVLYCILDCVALQYVLYTQLYSQAPVVISMDARRFSNVFLFSCKSSIKPSFSSSFLLWGDRGGGMEEERWERKRNQDATQLLCAHQAPPSIQLPQILELHVTSLSQTLLQQLSAEECVANRYTTLMWPLPLHSY